MLNELEGKKRYIESYQVSEFAVVGLQNYWIWSNQREITVKMHCSGNRMNGNRLIERVHVC